MKLCFCRFLLAVAIVVIAIFFWQASWAKIVVIIGAGSLGRDVVRQFGKHSHSDMRLVGYLDDDPKKVDQIIELTFGAK